MDNLNSPLTITPELLGLEDIEIIGTKLTSSGEIIIQVKSTKETINCHCCGKPTKAYGHGQEQGSLEQLLETAGATAAAGKKPNKLLFPSSRILQDCRST